MKGVIGAGKVFINVASKSFKCKCLNIESLFYEKIWKRQVLSPKWRREQQKYLGVYER